MKCALFSLLLGLSLTPLSGQNVLSKRHSITPIIGVASNTITPLTIAPSSDLKIDYVNGDALRLPLTLRYQYQIKKNDFIGLDVLGNFNTLMLHPAYKTQNFGFAGPSVITHSGTMIGGDIHYSRSADLKLFRVFGLLGLGAYRQQPDNTYTQDYSWYRNASSEFYDFAVAATNNVIKKWLPVTNLGLGIRYKHLELGVNFQYALSSPVKGFSYKGVQYDNAIRFSSKGCFVAYRFDF